MRVVLDTNVMLMAIPRHSKYAPILDELIEGNYEIAYSTEILFEYQEIIANHSSVAVANKVLEMIANLPNAILITPYFRFNLIQSDPDDNKFVDCAITANVKFIVSNDKHFNILKHIDFPKVEVVKIDDFLAWIEENAK
jgi:uncharacterized protein